MPSVRTAHRFRAVVVSAILVACGGHGPAPPASLSGSNDMIRFLALGDSYTIGEGVAEEQRWPVQLAVSLREHGLRIGEPDVIAKTGWTTDELSEAITKAKPTGGYELVSLLIGVNNQYRGRSEEEYRTQFRSLLTRAIHLAGNDARRVIVLSIPDWGVTPFAEGRDRQQITREIDRFNAINRDETSRSGAHYVDITPGSRAAGTDPTLIAGDGLHPSAKMYSSWAKQALPAAMSALGASGETAAAKITQ